ncbi:flagellar biosynthesis anti-sigma factor FlgM [Sphingomonas bacterium]|uniref:flagellar biosynthesis anti-sigma factor FlgM n=1 Tax=Sphingomonas bacterium TaxID=1895847 RepID=UPI0020C5E93F|nr:flagellar biosynthesis anti-sigma factor FlgM [Sphingomonas bacterium]
MVDPIGVKTVTMVDAAAPRAATAAPNPVAPSTPAAMSASTSGTAQTEANALARSMAAAAPVDPNRIAEIRHAIANGTFPILPATIADRLLALRMEWNSNDKA